MRGKLAEVTFVTHTSATDAVFDRENHNKVMDTTSVRIVDPRWMEVGMKRAIAVCLGVFPGLLATVATAAAEQPVAIVEDIKGKVTGAELMDYLTPRTVIKLGADSSIVISYLKSCRREKIDGIGTVVVGTEESLVHLASVKDEKTDCDASHAHATTMETSEVAATVVRSLGNNNAPIKPQLTLYGASPLVQATGRGTLVVERLDVSGERQQIELDGKQSKGKFYDFAAAKKALSPGGVYSAKFRSSRIVFQVDAQARPGATPMLGRLVRMD